MGLVYTIMVYIVNAQSRSGCSPVLQRDNKSRVYVAIERAKRITQTPDLFKQFPC